MKTSETFTEDFAELMNVWNAISSEARKLFPTKSEEEIYQITKNAIAKSLKIEVTP